MPRGIRSARAATRLTDRRPRWVGFFIASLLLALPTTGWAADKTPPSKPVVTDDGAYTSSTSQLHATWTSRDPESGIAAYRYLIRQDAPNGKTIVNWTAVGQTTSITRTGLKLLRNKTYYVGVQAKNRAGLWSTTGYSDGIAVVIDTTPPTGSVTINGQAAYATTPQTTLTLSASDNLGVVTLMRFSHDNAQYTTPEPYATKKNWTLTTGDGVKTVYVKFADAVGNWSLPASDTITLDTTPPTGAITIEQGRTAVNHAAVTLSLSATDALSGVAQMRFSNDNATYTPPEPYATTKSWTLATGDGAKTVYAKFQDAAGNWSPPVSDTIVLDTTPPVVTITSPTDGAVVGAP